MISFKKECRRSLKTLRNVFLSMLFAVCCCYQANAQVVITNASNNIAHLDKSSLRALYLMRLRDWPDGEQVTVFVLDDSSAVHKEFCRARLGVFPYQLRQRWDRLVFTGTGQAPILVNSLKEMKEMVANTKGSIGYINKDQVDGTIKTITISNDSL